LALQWNQRARYRERVARLLPVQLQRQFRRTTGGVGVSYAVFAAYEPGLAMSGWLDPRAHDYAIQVDADVEALDKDIQSQLTQLSVGQSFFGAWNGFVNGHANPDQADGWRDYFTHLRRLREFVSSDTVMAEIGGYQRRLRDFYTQFIAAGGKPTNPMPTLGFDPAVAARAEAERPTPWYEKAVTWTLVLGSIVAVGYLLHGVSEMGAVVQKAGLFEKKRR